MKPSAPTVLVVDDTPASLGVACNALRQEGVRVLLADSGEAARAVLAHERPEVVLLDVMMPGEDGFAVCASLKANPAWRDLPVVFITAVDEPAQKVRAFSAGAVDYVTKPVHVPELVARVRVQLELRAARLGLEAKNAELTEEIAVRVEAEARLSHSLDRAVLVAEVAGRITFATELAEHLLRKYFAGSAPKILPAELQALLRPGAGARLVLERGGHQLLAQPFTAPAGGPQGCLLLEELRPEPTPALLVPLGLTLREAEVLYWVAEGKSSPDIGLLLGLSPRTVEKHLENTYRKLGVENRSSALRTALEVLGRKA